MNTDLRPTPEVRLAQSFEVFDLSPIRRRSRSPMVVSLRIDGRVHYALRLTGKPATLSGAPAVVAFDGPHERRVLGWYLPATGEMQIVQGWSLWMGLLPAGFVTFQSTLLASRVLPAWGAVMVGATVLGLCVWGIRGLVRRRKRLKESLIRVAAADAVLPPDPSLTPSGAQAQDRDV